MKSFLHSPRAESTRRARLLLPGNIMFPPLLGSLSSPEATPTWPLHNTRYMRAFSVSLDSSSHMSAMTDMGVISSQRPLTITCLLYLL
jgi:hypothetical protein